MKFNTGDLLFKFKGNRIKLLSCPGQWRTGLMVDMIYNIVCDTQKRVAFCTTREVACNIPRLLSARYLRGKYGIAIDLFKLKSIDNCQYKEEILESFRWAADKVSNGCLQVLNLPHAGDNRAAWLKRLLDSTDVIFIDDCPSAPMLKEEKVACISNGLYDQIHLTDKICVEALQLANTERDKSGLVSDAKLELGKGEIFMKLTQGSRGIVDCGNLEINMSGAVAHLKLKTNLLCCHVDISDNCSSVIKMLG